LHALTPFDPNAAIPPDFDLWPTADWRACTGHAPEIFAQA